MRIIIKYGCCHIICTTKRTKRILEQSKDRYSGMKPKIKLWTITQKNILSFKSFLIFLDVTSLLSRTVIPISLEPWETIEHSAYENWFWKKWKSKVPVQIQIFIPHVTSEKRLVFQYFHIFFRMFFVVHLFLNFSLAVLVCELDIIHSGIFRLPSSYLFWTYCCLFCCCHVA